MITFERVVHIITGSFHFFIELHSKPALHIITYANYAYYTMFH